MMPREASLGPWGALMHMSGKRVAISSAHEFCLWMEELGGSGEHSSKGKAAC